jgi:hypothetical protein
MRARMSDAYGRASSLCAFVPPQSFPCVENDRAIGAATADKALNEARSILAETERVPTSPISRGIYMRAADLWAAPGASQALAESLRSFVEGN